jgi:hypothetical protein
VSGAVPETVTLNVAVCPAVTVLLAGWAVIDGATDAEVTVSVAELLVTLPLLSVTTTENREPLSAAVVAGVVYDAEVAPAIAAAPFFHWYVNVPAPAATTENVAVFPATTLWFSGWAVMASAAVPVPLRFTVRGEFVASLAMLMLPETLPAVVGANWTWKG